MPPEPAVHEIFPNPLVKHAQFGIIFAEPLPHSSHPVLIRRLCEIFPGADWRLGTGSRLDAGGNAEIGLMQASADGDAISLFPTALYLETARYGSFQRFRHLLERVIGPLDADVSTAVSAVQLRYVDEIRVDVPASAMPAGWQPYVTFQMIQGIPGLEGQFAGGYGGLLLHCGPNRHLSLEWSITEQDAIPADHPLVSWYPSLDKPALVLDWVGHATPESPIPFGANAVLGLMDAMYSDIRDAFAATITDKCRELMRGKI